MLQALGNNVLALLPEYVLTIVGVLIMLLEPLLPASRSRRPLGWFAIAGTTVAVGISFWQLQLGIMNAFSNSVARRQLFGVLPGADRRHRDRDTALVSRLLRG